MERDAVTETVAHNIVAAMEAREMNPASLARAAGINPTGVYDIMKGKSRSPKIETIQKLARALNLPVAMLFESRLALELRNELLDVAAQLPEQEQRRLLSAAKSWLSEAAPDAPAPASEQAAKR